MTEILWSAIVRWDRPRPDRVVMRIPCSSRERAIWLRRQLETGKVQDGCVVVQGSRTGQVARRLGWPEEVCEALEGLESGRGLRDGVREIRMERARRLDLIFRMLSGRTSPGS